MNNKDKLLNMTQATENHKILVTGVSTGTSATRELNQRIKAGSRRTTRNTIDNFEAK